MTALSTWATVAVVGLGLATSARLSWHLEEAPATALAEGVGYTLPPSTLRRLSLGYEGLTANLYWTRAVQYFGRRHYQQAASYEELAPLLETATALDPHLLVAYEFGANFLAPRPPNGAGMPEKAVELLEFGIRQNPNEWRLYYALGFVHYMERKDYASAAQVFERGSRVPGAHPFLRILAAQMAQHAGEIETARMLWTATLQTAQEQQVRDNARAHLRALQVEQDVTLLEQAVEQYQVATGRVPPALAALVASGLLPGLPLDPDGHPYRLNRGGSIEVAHPGAFPFAEKGVPQNNRRGNPR